MTARHLKTRCGIINFPTYLPVTTFGRKYPLDKLIQPYLPRLAQGMMVSYHYAQQIEEKQRLPVWVDSGGFASLFKNAQIKEKQGLGIIEIQKENELVCIQPRDVLALQERVADVAFTLDFPIPPQMAISEAQKRQQLTITNALWALQNRRRRDLPLFACVQAWDEASASRCTQAYAGQGFDGIAIGGLVPRAKDESLVLSIVKAVKAVCGELPLHVFGLGKPDMVTKLYDLGVDSVDSSSYVKMAANGRLWSHPHKQIQDPSPIDRLHLALCNLAFATGATLPLSAHKMMFTTASLANQ